MNFSPQSCGSKSFLVFFMAMAVAVAILPGLEAQTNLTVLHDFNNGQNPDAALVQGNDGNFYGTTYTGGAYNDGTVFKISPSGTMTTLVSFNGANGAEPQAALVQGSDGNFYGTTVGGGTQLFGTVFKVTPSGTLTTLHSFNGGNTGYYPNVALVQGSDGNFYGASVSTIFRITPTGSLTNLAAFGANCLMQGSDGNFYGQQTGGNGTIFRITPTGTVTNFAGSSGSGLMNSIVQGTDGNFYGTKLNGGSTTLGLIWEMTPSGTFTILYTFTGGSDGLYPNALVQGSDGNFYGTTGNNSNGNYKGAVFQYTLSGTLTTLASFSGVDGAQPSVGLVQGNDGNFYGTTYSGGAANHGVVFNVTSSGTLTTMYSFDSDGDEPYAGLIQGTDGNLYGTTLYGGTLNGLLAANAGTVFKITTNGLFTSLYTFATTNANYYTLGNQPYAALLQGSNGNFYGTTSTGVPFDTGTSPSVNGTVFEMTPSGNLVTLADFSGTNGSDPRSALVQGKDGDLYGATTGGASGAGLAATTGAIFKVSPSIITELAAFNNSASTGFYPNGLLQGSDGNFYGTAQTGGTQGGYGTVFKMTSSGTLTALVSFDFNNGATPYAGLIQGNDGNFYGTTESGGASFDGTVFKVTPSGTLTTLASFNGANGANPYASLVQRGDGNFYGTTYSGGASNLGTVFEMTPSGTLTTLVSFTGVNGANPYAGLIQGNDGNLYGTTYGGGGCGVGTVFRVSLPEVIQVVPVLTSPPPGSTLTSSTATFQWSSGTGVTNYFLYVGTSLGTNNIFGRSAGLNLSQTVTNLPVNGSTLYVRLWWATAAAGWQSADYTYTAYTQPDTTKPTVAITSPTAKETVYGSNFTLTGTAGDNVGVAGVYYSLNGSSWILASTSDNWAHWSAGVTLTPGVNTVSAAAVDTSNNDGYTAAIQFNYVAYAPLTVQINGNGKVSPADNGKLLQIGNSYSLKATPNKGSVFVNWTGSLTTTSRTLNFIMASNLTFTANFQIKP